ncbi:MAG: WYL domain-containing protein [Oscillochloris sp.]|nr:WYL domain-containing protein [Oscillochloris sp.]
MTKPSGGGIKRSSWLTFRRRLLLVRALLRAPATSEALVAMINAELGGQGYPQAAAAALKHDLDALKGEYGCQITYERASSRYALTNLGELALLDVPDEELEALAFLDASLPERSDQPTYAHIRSLLERILLLLPPARQAQHRRKGNTSRRQDKLAAAIAPEIMNGIKRAIKNRRELCFRYCGTSGEESPRQHRVAPYRIYQGSDGNTYLDATLLEVSPLGQEATYAAIDYRIDRIVPGSVALLKAPLPPERPSPPCYRLRYSLTPQIARFYDITPLFPAAQISYRDDGSAEITATIGNLQQAQQLLLRYGAGCTVHEPAELIALFRVTARELSAIYCE